MAQHNSRPHPSRDATLVKGVGQYILASLAPSSRILYAKCAMRLRDFAVSLETPSIWFPAPVSLICTFIVHLLETGLAPSTILSTLSAISFFHKLFHFEDPTTDFLVKHIVLGAQKTHPSSDDRLPITIPILHKLCDSCTEVTSTAYAATLLRALYLFMFHAFLHVGEVTNSRNNIEWSHLTMLPDSATITFHRAKHLVGPPISVSVPSEVGQYCPIANLRRYLSMRGESPGPLFCYPDCHAISTSQFNAWLKLSLSHASLFSLAIKSHSFRIGATSHAAAIGYSETQIQKMGRWHSDAFKRYIRIPSFQSI